MTHAWYSAKDHKHLLSIYNPRFVVDGICGITGFVAVPPKVSLVKIGHLTLSATHINSSLDTTYEWPDKVYLGEFRPEDHRLVPASEVPVQVQK